MSTTPDFIEYVCEQIAGVGALRSKKMFGEYMIYVEDKPALLICDNTVYIKRLEALAAVMQNTDIGIPYPGAKPHYILDIDDAEFSKKIIRCLEPLLSLPQPRKKKS
ncbi:MAG: TfoX/Sxy family protein [Zoogloeaceae bacterium]|jgi:TfoX/Sxy family transcriptional regulator of competence genes|nr:TfoX/Sxy family protein [Zoogloeaceae bacterium]